MIEIGENVLLEYIEENELKKQRARQSASKTMNF